MAPPIQTLSEPKDLPPLHYKKELPDVSHIVIEDNTPVDGIYSEKQMRLLTHPLYCCWQPLGGGPFLALANVGMFFDVNLPPMVPDVLLSLGVYFDDQSQKINRSYFFVKFGKAPDAVLEIVSNNEGDELGEKLRKYAEIGIPYYVVWDPYLLRAGRKKDPARLFAFHLESGSYVSLDKPWLTHIGLGLSVWHGTFEKMADDWLRWCDDKGVIIPTGEESAQRAEQERQRAEQERQRAEQERQRAEQEQHRAEQERQRAEQERQQAEQRMQRLAEQLRKLGVEPTE